MPLSNSTTLYFLPVFVFKKDMINSDISVVLKPQIYSIFDIYKKVSNFKKISKEIILRFHTIFKFLKLLKNETKKYLFKIIFNLKTIKIIN